MSAPIRRILFSVIFSLGFSVAAMAQEGVDPGPAPPQEMAPLPTGVSPQPPVTVSNAGMPELPPSQPCTLRDLLGVWRLVQVYELPQGAQSSDFTANPVQYLAFLQDNVFGKYNAGGSPVPVGTVISAVQQESNTSLQQYLLQDTGVMYFYQNQVAVDNQVCFIAVNRRGPFLVGEMLLMPPEGQSAVRVVKVYKKESNLPQENRRGRGRGKGRRGRRNRQQDNNQ